MGDFVHDGLVLVDLSTHSSRRRHLFSHYYFSVGSWEGGPILGRSVLALLLLVLLFFVLKM